MPDFPPSFAFVRAVLVACLCVVTLGAKVPDTPFTDSVTASTREAMGIALLSPAQIAELNRLVSRELMLARQGGVKGFAKTFTERRPPAEFSAAGLDRLSPAQRKEIDRSVAWAMTIPDYHFYPSRFKSDIPIETVKAPNRVQTSVSVMAGMGSDGRSVFGGSIAMTYRNPERGVAATVEYAEYKGDRWIVDDPYLYGPYGYYMLDGTSRSLSVTLEFGK